MDTKLNYKEGETKVIKFLRDSTDATDMIWVTESGWYTNIVFIDCEDIFCGTLPAKYYNYVVDDARVVGTYTIFNEKDNSISTGRYITLEIGPE